MKKKLVLLALILALVLGISQTANAAGGGMNSGQPHGALTRNPEWVPLVEKLNLSDQQAQQLKELNLNTYQAAKPLKAKLQDARFELRQLGLDKKANKAAVDAKIKEINDLQAQLHKIRQEKWKKVQTILTAEQQSKLKAMKGRGQHGGRCR